MPYRYGSRQNSITKKLKNIFFSFYFATFAFKYKLCIENIRNYENIRKTYCRQAIAN